MKTAVVLLCLACALLQADTVFKKGGEPYKGGAWGARLDLGLTAEVWMPIACADDNTVYTVAQFSTPSWTTTEAFAWSKGGEPYTGGLWGYNSSDHYWYALACDQYGRLHVNLGTLEAAYFVPLSGTPTIEVVGGMYYDSVQDGFFGYTAGSGWERLTTGTVEVYNFVEYFTAGGVNNDFTLTHEPLGDTVSAVTVWVGGSLQPRPGTDYTYNSGTDTVTVSGSTLASGTIVTVQYVYH